MGQGHCCITKCIVSFSLSMRLYHVCWNLRSHQLWYTCPSIIMLADSSTGSGLYLQYDGVFLLGSLHCVVVFLCIIFASWLCLAICGFTQWWAPSYYVFSCFAHFITFSARLPFPPLMPYDYDYYYYYYYYYYYTLALLPITNPGLLILPSTGPDAATFASIFQSPSPPDLLPLKPAT